MNNTAASARLAVLMVLLALLSGGCTYTHTLHAEVSLDSLPRVEKVPVTAGVYYSRQFRAFSHTRIFGSHKYVAPIGADSVALFNKLLPMVFQKVVPVGSPPPYQSVAPNVDMVLEPSIEHFNFVLGMDSLSEEKSIVYRFAFYNLDGSPIDSWSIRGQPENESRWATPAGYIENDLEDAALRFLNKFSAGEPGRTAILQAVGKPAVAKTAPDQSLRQVAVRVTPVREPIQSGGEPRVLNDLGVVVLDVTIENGSDKPVGVDVTSFRLELSEVNRFAPSDAASLFSRLEKRSFSGDVTSALFGAAIGLAVTVAEDVQKESIQRSLQEQLEPKMLKPAIALAPGQSVSGLLLFVPPLETGSFSRARLTLWLKGQDQQQLPRVINLENVNYKSIKPVPTR